MIVALLAEFVPDSALLTAFYKPHTRPQAAARFFRRSEIGHRHVASRVLVFTKNNANNGEDDAYGSYYLIASPSRLSSAFIWGDLEAVARAAGRSLSDWRRRIGERNKMMTFGELGLRDLLLNRSDVKVETDKRFRQSLVRCPGGAGE